MAIPRSLAPLSAIVALLAAFPAAADPGKRTQVKWLGHAAFQVTTPAGKVLLIDPWISNPVLPNGKEVAAGIAKADYILVSHGHFDHIGDAVEIAKRTGAKLVASFPLATNLVRIWGYPAAQAGMDTSGDPGGELRLPGGEVTIAFTPAVHSSGLDYPGAGEKETRPVAYGGSPVGFVIRIQGGPTIYHSGDTAFFRDMEVIGETYAPEVSLLNIGGHFGMEPAMAARAASALKTKLVVPHHFKTFPLLTQDAGAFFAELDKRKIAHAEPPPGGTLSFEGKKLAK